MGTVLAQCFHQDNNAPLDTQAFLMNSSCSTTQPCKANNLVRFCLLPLRWKCPFGKQSGQLLPLGKSALWGMGHQLAQLLVNTYFATDQEIFQAQRPRGTNIPPHTGPMHAPHHKLAPSHNLCTDPPRKGLWQLIWFPLDKVGAHARAHSSVWLDNVWVAWLQLHRCIQQGMVNIRWSLGVC